LDSLRPAKMKPIRIEAAAERCDHCVASTAVSDRALLISSMPAWRILAMV
jgi:hypothetical protein